MKPGPIYQSKSVYQPKPVYPMEPVSSNTIPRGEDWIATIKWDGVRILTYFAGRVGGNNSGLAGGYHSGRAAGQTIALLNRKQNVRTNHYPELLDIRSYCDAESVILDGEVIALGPDGKPSFHEIMRRDGIRRMDKLEYVMKTVPIAYMIFDVIFFNGEWLTKTAICDRMELLNHIIQPNQHVQIVKAYDDGEELFRFVQAENMEGIVMKRRNSLYFPSEKKNIWQKVKNYKDIFAVIGGFTMRDGAINAVLVGAYRQDGLCYIGHVGTGRLTGFEWRELAKKLVPTVVSDKPFINCPERSAGTFWVTPAICVKVQFLDWTNHHSMRQPSIQAIVDISPKECIL